MKIMLKTYRQINIKADNSFNWKANKIKFLFTYNADNKI